ncbi:MAG: helix-turn-helix transcriptional regulator [Candidatus Altiarchaeota archaeon]|nr:helix-turn-helix transcriptional regulator [Candidatus Altiarchaeota archaeon]
MDGDVASEQAGLGVFCPLKETLKLLGKRWTILIIKEIYYSKRNKLSFMELKRLLVDVSTKMLSERLKEMQENGLIIRKVKDDVKPARVYYSLTDKGDDACDILEALKQYGRKWGGEKVDCKELNCELCVEKRLAANH